jgi:hypothetical protein
MKTANMQGTKFLKMLPSSSSAIQNCFIQLLSINKNNFHLLLHELSFQRLFKVHLVEGRKGKKGRDILLTIGHPIGYIMHSEQMGNSTPWNSDQVMYHNLRFS